MVLSIFKNFKNQNLNKFVMKGKMGERNEHIVGILLEGSIPNFTFFRKQIKLIKYSIFKIQHTFIHYIKDETP